MKIIDANKLLAVTLGTAGLFWATNKKLPDWLVVATLLAAGVTLVRDVSQLVIETEPEKEIQNMGYANPATHCCVKCAAKSLQLSPFDIQF